MNESEKLIEKIFIGDWQELSQLLGDSLLEMNSTDFKPDGLNEVGFKALVIAHLKTLLLMCDPEYEFDIISEKIVSFVGDKYGFVDLMLVQRETKRRVLMELKYIKMHRLHYPNQNSFLGTGNQGGRKLWFDKCMELKDMSTSENEALLYKEHNTLKLKSLKELLDKAWDQAKNYNESDDFKEYHENGETVIVGAIVGYGSHVVCGAKNFKKEK